MRSSRRSVARLIAAIGCMFVYTMRSSQRSVARPIAAIDRATGCMYVYTVRSPRRSRVCLHGAIAATIASCKHRITARQSNSGRQPNFAALNTGRHLYSAGRPSRWTLAHIPVTVVLKLSFSFYRVIRLLSRKNVKNICICICIIDKLYTMTTSSDDT